MKLILISILLMTGLHTARAQNSSDATIQALLAEVRQLRLALERSALVTPKIQVALQRIQIQNDTVARLSREAEESRTITVKVTDEQAELTAELPRAEAMVAEEKDPVKKKDFEEQVRRMKVGLSEKNAASIKLQ